MSWAEILILAVISVVVLAVSRRLRIFRAIHSVQRATFGEFWSSVSVGLLLVVWPHTHIYTAAMLELSLADGLAAVIGTAFGRRHRYRVFGAQKSVIGTAAFFIVSCLILIGYQLATPGAHISC